MKTIQIELPDPIISFIHSLSKQEEAFAREAVEEKVIREKRKNLASLLAKGYQATAQEDLAISKEFERADFENL